MAFFQNQRGPDLLQPTTWPLRFDYFKNSLLPSRQPVYKGEAEDCIRVGVALAEEQEDEVPTQGPATGVENEDIFDENAPARRTPTRTKTPLLPQSIFMQ